MNSSDQCSDSLFLCSTPPKRVTRFVVGSRSTSIKRNQWIGLMLRDVSLRAYEQKQKALRLFGCRGLARAVQSFLVVCGRRAVTAGVVGAALARSHVWRRSLVRLSRALCPSVAHTPFREVHRPQMGAAATQHARQGVMSGPVLGIVTRVGPDGSAEILRSFDRCYNNAVKNTGTCVSVGGRSC